MANTYSLMQIWEMQYEVTHYKQPVFRAFAEEKFTPDLYMGATFNRQYAGDLVVNAMTAAGGYSVQGFTNTNESGSVNIKEETSVQVVEWQKLQDHLPTQMKYTTKAANALWLQVDSILLYGMAVGSNTVIDDQTINGAAGTKGNPVTAGIQNIQNIFTAAIQQLQLQNVVYDPNKALAKDVKFENISDALVAAISPQGYNLLLQYIGGKTTILGDTISRNGHVGIFMGFNLFVSNQLPWEGILALGTNPTDGDTFTLLKSVTVAGTAQDLTIRFKTTPVAAGDVVIASTAAKTVTNLVNALKAPYTTIANGTDTGFVAWTQSSLTVWQQKMLYNAKPVQTAVATNLGASNAAGTYLDLVIAGQGNVPTAVSMTAAANKFGNLTQHWILGTSKSISLLMQSTPHLFVNPVSSAVARDLVTWSLYGYKVFTDQAAQIIGTQIDATNFGTGGTSPNIFL